MSKISAKLFREYGRIGGLKGGKVSLETMTAEQRSERARKAGLASAKLLTPEERSARARKAGLARARQHPANSNSSSGLPQTHS